MSPVQFFYWLQGYFEISGSQDALSAEQGEIIGRHIALIVEWSKGDGRRRGTSTLPERVIEIRTLLSLLTTSPDMVTTEIRKRINDEFVHVIDPEAGGAATQAALNHTHGNELVRC